MIGRKTLSCMAAKLKYRHEQTHPEHAIIAHLPFVYLTWPWLAMLTRYGLPKKSTGVYNYRPLSSGVALRSPTPFHQHFVDAYAYWSGVIRRLSTNTWFLIYLLLWPHFVVLPFPWHTQFVLPFVGLESSRIGTHEFNSAPVPIFGFWRPPTASNFHGGHVYHRARVHH